MKKSTWAVTTNSPKFSFPCLYGGNESLPTRCTPWFYATVHPINLFQLTVTLSLTSLLAKLFTNKKQHQRHPGNLGSAMLFLHCLSCVCRILVCHVSIISCVPTLYFMGTRRQIPGAINTQSSSWWRMNLPFYCLWLEGCFFARRTKQWLKGRGNLHICLPKITLG